jgi:RimJ/RimL family protein N-acetyltransferase
MNPPSRAAILRDRVYEIRPLEVGEAPALFAAVHASLEHIGRWENWCTPDYDLAAARSYLELSWRQWEEGRGFNYNVIERDSRLVVGSISLNQLDPVNARANVGYWTRSSHIGRGIAPNAVRALARLAFRRLELVRLEIVAQEANQSSRRVAEKVGARFEGIARDRLIYHGEPRSAAVYSLVRSDFPSGLRSSFARRRSAIASL